MLKIRMFGQAEIVYGDSPILSGKNKITKSMELLFVLLHRGKEGVARNKLIDALSGAEEVADGGNSLRVTVHRLGKLLLDAGLPEDTFVSNKDGIYRWNGSVDLEVDIQQFRQLLEEATGETDGEKKADKLKAACRLYRGEFLPKLSGQEWVLLAAASYKKMYTEALEWLIDWMKEQGEYEELQELVDTACHLYPFEEWQTVKIDCYMARGLYEEAMEEYEHTARMLAAALGVVPSERMMEQFREMSSHISSRPGVIEEIKEGLQEKQKEKGAYFCTLPSFRDVYRMVRRNMERSGQSVYLLACSLTDSRGQALERGEKLDALTEGLDEAIRESLRSGDAYTRYSASQYLVMLTGISRENCRIVIERITDSFTKEHKSWVKRLHCCVTSLYDEEG